MPSERAPLVEIFHSIQGEGSFLGEPMVFLRVAVCPIRCLYCDTPHSYVAAKHFPVRRGSASEQEQNPVDAARAAVLVADVERHSRYGTSPRGHGPRVSITGGEPLLYPGFVQALGGRLRPAGWRVHLETAALDADALASCLDGIDHLSADWKLPETLPDGSHEQQHARCVELAVGAGKSVDVKVVLTPALAWESFGRALAALAGLEPKIVLVLQPVTPFGAVTRAPAPDLVAEGARRARAAGFSTRVMPQAHKLLGVE
jgi:organic radical activating enzyme